MAVCVTAKHMGGRSSSGGEGGGGGGALCFGEEREGQTRQEGGSASRGSCMDVRGGTQLFTLVSAHFLIKAAQWCSSNVEP